MIHLPSSEFKTPTGTLRVQVVSARIWTTTMSGCLDVELAKHFLESANAWIELGGSELLAFHDWEDVHDYDARARQHLTPWSKAHRPKFERVHMLVRGRALAWGINIVNAVTGDLMTVHHARESFDAAQRSRGIAPRIRLLERR